MACEGQTSRTWNVHNLSASDVHVEYKYRYTDADDTLLLSGELLEIAYEELLGGQNEAGEPFESIDSLLIFNVTDTCTKDFKLSENWIIVSDHTSRLPSIFKHVFTFEIEDKDF
jgi:hypothetical protein